LSGIRPVDSGDALEWICDGVLIARGPAIQGHLMDERLAWFTARASAILAPDGVPAYDEKLFSIAHLADTENSPLARATIIAAIWAWYGNAEHPDQIVHRLRDLGLVSSSASDADICSGLVVPACTAFRDGQAPFERWWESDTIYWSLLAVLMRRANIAPEASATWLADRWGMCEPSMVTYMTRLAATQWSLAVDSSATATSFREILRQADLADALTEAQAAEPAELAERPALAHMARECYAVLMLDKALSEVDEPNRERLLATVTPQRRVIGELLARLTPYEAQLVAPGTRQDRMLEAIATNPPDSVFMEHMLDGLPDRTMDGIRLPRWMRDYIIRGGHTQQAIVGGFPYWFGVTDAPMAHAGLANRPRGLTIEDLPQGLVAHVVIDDGEPSPLHLPFTFSRGFFATTATLALIAIKGTVRFDVLHVDRHGSLALVASHRINLPSEAIALMRDTALAHLDETGIASAEDFFNARRRETLETNDPAVGFDGLDLGKAEELIRPDDPLLREPEQRVLELRDIRAQAIWHGRPTDKIDATLIAAETEELNALQGLRARAAENGRRPISLEPLRTVAERVLPPGTSFVHLGLAERGLECMAAGGGDYWIEDIEVGELSSERVRQLVLDWVRSGDSTPEKLRRMLEPLDTMGRSLAALVERRSLSRLILSPAWYAHALPLHLARAADDAFLVDIVPSIVYARSLRLLDGGPSHKWTPDPIAASFAFSADDDLPYAAREAALVGALFNTTPHTDSNATISEFVTQAPQSDLVHIAAHGLHVLGDHWSSGVTLADGFLSSARVRQLPLSGSVAVLAACSSGLAINHGLTRENFGGLDRAFLDAGVDAVVGALWSIEDFASCLFTGAFLISWRSTGNPESAMRDAVRFLRDPAISEVDGKLGAELDRTVPGWRSSSASRDIALSDPLIWGAFRLSIGSGGLQRSALVP
jgi:CHAT domain-containing protein